MVHAGNGARTGTHSTKVLWSSNRSISGTRRERVLRLIPPMTKTSPVSSRTVYEAPIPGVAQTGDFFEEPCAEIIKGGQAQKPC